MTFLSDYKEEISLALGNTRKIRSSARPHPDWLQVDGGPRASLESEGQEQRESLRVESGERVRGKRDESGERV